MKYIYIFSIVVLLHSCKPSQINCHKLYPPPPIDTTISYLILEQIFRDTTIISADTSAWMKMLFECDSSGKALISEISNQYGRRSKINADFDKKERAISAIFKCKCDSLAIYKEFKSMDTTLTKTIVKHFEIPVPADLTWWEKFKIQYGGYAIGFICSILFVILLWVAWKIFSLTPYGAAISGGGNILNSVGKIFKR